MVQDICSRHTIEVDGLRAVIKLSPAQSRILLGDADENAQAVSDLVTKFKLNNRI